MAVTFAEAVGRLAALARRYPQQQCYLVGGLVRDALLGRPTTDADLAVGGDCEGFASAAAAALDSRVVAVGAAFRLFRIPLADGYVDVAPMQGSLEADLARRDFTVNAFAIPLGELTGGPDGITAAQVVDRHGGIDDLHRRTLRPLTPHALADDPVRVLRAVRLACELDFQLDADAARQLGAAALGLRAVAAERVGAELLRLFACSRAADGIRLMDRHAVLDTCFPALAEGRGVEQRPWHLHDAYEHQLLAARWADVLLAEEPPADSDEANVWQSLWGDRSRTETPWGGLRDVLRQHAPAVRLATLLHDVGKPATRSLEPDGRTRFFGHAELGARLAREMLTGWRLPGDVIDRVCLLIGQHLRPGQVAAPGRAPTARSLYRFHQALGDATPDVCFLYLADSLATRGYPALSARWPAYVQHVRSIVSWQPPAEASEIRRLVDGHAVMRATGLAPGPAVGRVLARVREAAAAGQVDSVEQALALAVDIAREQAEG